MSFTSQKWAHWTTADNSEVLRVSLGQDGLRIDHLDDDQLIERAVDKVGRHLVHDLAPTDVRVSRWPAAFPQYRPCHQDWLAASGPHCHLVFSSPAPATEASAWRRASLGRSDGRDRRCQLRPPACHTEPVNRVGAALFVGLMLLVGAACGGDSAAPEPTITALLRLPTTTTTVASTPPRAPVAVAATTTTAPAPVVPPPTTLPPTTLPPPPPPPPTTTTPRRRRLCRYRSHRRWRTATRIPNCRSDPSRSLGSASNARCTRESASPPWTAGRATGRALRCRASSATSSSPGTRRSQRGLPEPRPAGARRRSDLQHRDGSAHVPRAEHGGRRTRRRLDRRPDPAQTGTLFACHPPGSTRQRIVVHLELAA